VLEVNVAGLAATLAAFAPAMREAGRGTLAGIAERRRIPRPGGERRLLRVQVGGDHLAGEPARRDVRQRGFGGVRLPRLHRHADDARQPLSHAVPDQRRRRGAAAFARAIEAKRRLAVIPWQMALVSLLLRAMPGWLFDRLASRAPRKPRDVAV
jgi:hypothetical protein